MLVMCLERVRAGALALCVVAVCVVCGSACGEDPIDAAESVAGSCGEQACPVGTAFKESRSITAGYDISGGIDPAEYQAEGAFARFGEGECEYACEVIQACPEGTFPVITADCFTCGVLNAEGEVQQGSCGG